MLSSPKTEYIKGSMGVQEGAPNLNEVIWEVGCEESQRSQVTGEQGRALYI